MASVEELYSLLLQPSNEAIEQATAALTELYSDPSNIGALIECLSSGSTVFIRNQAAIGVRQMILQHVSDYIEAGNIDELKEQVLTVLVSEGVKSVRTQIVNICSAFFNGNEMSWPELTEFANSLLGEESTTEQQELALKIYEIIVSNSPESEIVGLLDILNSLILTCLSTEDEILISSAADLTGVLTGMFEAPAPTQIVECYEKLIEVFHLVLSTGQDFSYRVANALEDVASEKSCISGKIVFSNLMEILQDEDIPGDKVFLIFTPLSSLIERRFEDVEEDVNTIIEAMMNASARAFTDGCATEQEDLYFICQTIDTLIEGTNTDEFFDVIQSQLSTDTPGQIFADVYFLQLFIEQAADTAANHIPLITEFLLSQITAEQEHSVIELIFECLHIFIKVVNAGLVDYTQPILEAGLNGAQSEHEPIAIPALNMLSELFTTIPIDLSAPGEILSTILTIAVNREGDVQERSLFCAYALIFAAGESVAEFAEQLLSVFKQAVEVPLEVHPKLRATGLLGIAILHKAIPEVMSPVLGETIALITELIQCEDLSVVNSTLTAATILAESPIEQVKEVLAIGIQGSMEVIDKEFPNEGEEEEEEYEESEEIRELVESKLNAIDLIRVSSEYHTDVVAQFAEPVVGKLIDLIQSNQPYIIASQAVKCLSVMTLKLGIDANEILAQLVDAFNHPSIDVVVELFRLSKKFVKCGIDIGQVQLQGVVSCAHEAITRDLACQDEEEQDFELLEQAYKFLKYLALNVPEIFPKDSFVRSFKIASKKNKYEQMSFMSLVFGDFYEKHSMALEPIEKTAISQCVFHALNGCDGYLPPYPFIAATKIIESDPEKASQFAQAGIEAAVQVYQVEAEGQPYLQDTYAAATAFILVLVKLSGGSIDISGLIEPLCSTFPIKEKHAAVIAYQALIVDFTNFTAIFEPAVTQLCVGLAKLFALTNVEFREIKLDHETTVGVANVLRAILTQAAGAEQVVDEQLANETASARYKERLASFV